MDVNLILCINISLYPRSARRFILLDDSDRVFVMTSKASPLTSKASPFVGHTQVCECFDAPISLPCGTWVFFLDNSVPALIFPYNVDRLSHICCHKYIQFLFYFYLPVA